MTVGYCSSNELFNCDFEQGLCGFMNDITGQFNWTRARGRINTYSYTGPIVDHTVI